jgi:hypothetical protein
MFEDNYPPPNDTARANAADAAERLRAAGLTPESPDDDVLGGLAVNVFRGDGGYVWVDCSNTGHVGCLLSSGLDNEAKAWDITDVGWPETIERVKAHLSEMET